MILDAVPTILIAFFAVIGGAILGCLISGVDRRVTAWLQGRYGPPIRQPLYDVCKLLGKKPAVVNSMQVYCAVTYFISSVLSFVLFVLGTDLLLIFFVMTVGSVFLVMGAYSTPSPYSQVGASRELIQMLTYEPLILLVFIGIYLVVGSFKIGDICRFGKPLLPMLPLLYVVLTYALTIKLRKSPFDFSTSHHGHQELVKGMLTEYSGPYLALIEIAHWYEVVLVLGFCSLFWLTSWQGMVVLLLVTYFAELIIDNVMARMTWRWMLKYVWIFSIAFLIINAVMYKYVK